MRRKNSNLRLLKTKAENFSAFQKLSSVQSVVTKLLVESSDHEAYNIIALNQSNADPHTLKCLDKYARPVLFGIQET